MYEALPRRWLTVQLYNILTIRIGAEPDMKIYEVSCKVV